MSDEIAGAIATLCTWLGWVEQDYLFDQLAEVGILMTREAYLRGIQVGREIGRTAALAELAPVSTLKS